MSEQLKWFRRRILAGTMRLLKGEEQDRFDELLASDADCERLHERITSRNASEAAATPGHVPAEILARWEKATTALRGLERTAVRRHVQQCASCRAALTRLGHEPELPYVEALELDPDSTAAFFPDVLREA